MFRSIARLCPYIEMFQKEERESYNLLFDKLDQFPQLKKISIVSYDEETQSIIECIESISEKAAARLEYINLALSINDHDQSIENLAILKPLLSMKHLVLGCTELFVSYEEGMFYIMEKFLNLNKLWDFDVHDEKRILFYDINITPSIDFTNQFLVYLSKMLDCIVDSIVTEENTVNVIKRFTQL